MMEEIADECLKDLRTGIDVERQLITAEHELHAKLYIYDNIFGHLDMERIDADHLHTLNHLVMEGIMGIRESLEAWELEDIKFVKEERLHAKQLTADIAHKDWHAVKKDIKAEADAEKKHVHVEKRHLKELHKRFKELMHKMKERKLVAALEEDNLTGKQKEDYKHAAEHYFVETYKFLRAYEKIIRELYEKEEHLARNLRKDATNSKRR